MGRKTFDSIGKPLPKRRNIVITRQTGLADKLGDRSATGADVERTNAILFKADPASPNDQTGLDIVASLDAALDLCRSRSEKFAFIVGGAQIYELALARADEMLITHVDQPDIDGDAFFPAWDPGTWRDMGPADEAFPLARRYVRI